MNIRWALFALACVAPLAWAEVPAKLFYTSQTDFTDITLTLKKAQALHPEFIEVDVTLTPQAQERTKALSQADPVPQWPAAQYGDGPGCARRSEPEVLHPPRSVVGDDAVADQVISRRCKSARSVSLPHSWRRPKLHLPQAPA